MPMIGLTPWLLGLAVEVVGAVQVAVVGHRDGRHAELAGAGEQPVEQRGPVEHGVLGVHVQVHEVVSGQPADMEETSAPFRGSLTGVRLVGVADGLQQCRSRAVQRGKSSQPTSVCTAPPTRLATASVRASRSRARGRGCRPPATPSRAVTKRPDGTSSVARDAGQHAAALVADPPAAPVGDQAGHQLVEPASVGLLEVGDDGRVEHHRRAVRRGLVEQAGQVVEQVAPRAATAGPRRATSTAARSRSRRSSCSGQTRFSSHAIASGSRTSSGLRSTPPRQATSGCRAGHRQRTRAPRPSAAGRRSPAARPAAARRSRSGRGRGTARRWHRPR